MPLAGRVSGGVAPEDGWLYATALRARVSCLDGTTFRWARLAWCPSHGTIVPWTVKGSVNPERGFRYWPSMGAG